METALSATATAFYKLSPTWNRFSYSFSTRTSQLAPLRLSKPLTWTSLPSNCTRKSLTPAASADGVRDLENSIVDAIVLHVRGMACEGCVSSVKKILESQPQVSSASVNLDKEMAIVWPVAEAKAIPNWQSQLGENLAKHLTSCGFSSNFQSQKGTEGDIPSYNCRRFRAITYEPIMKRVVSTKLDSSTICIQAFGPRH